MDGFLQEEEVGDDDGIPEDRHSELLGYVTLVRKMIMQRPTMSMIIDELQAPRRRATYRSDREAIRPVATVDRVDIHEVLIPERHCSGQENDADE